MEIKDATVTVPGVVMEKSKRKEEIPKEALWYGAQPVPLEEEGVKLLQPIQEPRVKLHQPVVSQIKLPELGCGCQEPVGQNPQFIATQAELMELAQATQGTRRQ